MKNLMTTTVWIFACAALLSFSAQAQQLVFKSDSVVVSPKAPPSAMVNAASSLTRNCEQPGCKLKVVLKNSCFATNLRNVSNPISPDSILTTDLTFVHGKDTYQIAVKYPGAVATATGLNSQSIQKYPTDNLGTNADNYVFKKNGVIIPKTQGYAATVGNMVMIYTPFQITEAAALTPKDFKRINIDQSKVNFNQEVTNCKGGPSYGSYGASLKTPAYPCGKYMAKTGKVSAKIGNLAVAKDNSSLEVAVSFPGQTGFCGGYFSPLMIFASEERPQFNSVSDFPLNPGMKTYWPEKNHPGYFLAWDRQKNGVISEADQLFGNSEKAQNGFEKLRQLDSNKDGWIDESDEKFQELVLWRDANSDGKSTASEIIPASQKVRKISLKYQKGHLRPIGRNAEEREIGSVELVNSQGVVKKARISDIWLSAYSGN